VAPERAVQANGARAGALCALVQRFGPRAAGAIGGCAAGGALEVAGALTVDFDTLPLLAGIRFGRPDL